MSKGFAHLNESTRCQRSPRAEQSRGEQRKEARLRRKDRREKEQIFTQTMRLYWAYVQSVILVCPHIEYSFLGEFSNPLTSNCYPIMQLSGLSWPHVLSEVNFEWMSMALSSTRCSALWLPFWPSDSLTPACYSCTLSGHSYPNNFTKLKMSCWGKNCSLKLCITCMFPFWFKIIQVH